MTSTHRVIGTLLALLLVAGCPGGSGSGGDRPPPLRTGAADPLAEPPAPAPGTEGLGYLEQVYPRLRDRWNSFVNDCRLRLPGGDPLNQSALRAVVTLEVKADGQLVNAAVTEASGNSDFDAAALEIAREAAPLPVVPRELLSDDGLLHLSWGFHRDRRLAGMATARVDRVRWPPEKAVAAFADAGALERASARLREEIDKQGATPAMNKLGALLAGAYIERALASDDASTRAAGVDAAARARLGATAPALENVVGSAVEADLRAAALRALGEVGAAGSKPLLLAELTADDAGSERAGAAAAALIQMGATSEVQAALAAEIDAGGDRQRRALAVAGDVAVPDALDSLLALTGSGERGTRAAACVAVGRAAAGADPSRRTAVAKVLRGHIGSRDAGLRAACVRGLELLAAGGAVSRVIYWKVVDLLKDRDDRVRSAAVAAAARMQPTRVGKELYRLRRESSPLVLAGLARGLAVARGADILPRLVPLAGHESPQVRRAAAEALATRDEPLAVDTLRKLVTDGDPRVQELALVAGGDPASLTDSAVPAVRARALTRWFAAMTADARLSAFLERAGAAEPAEAALLAGAWLAR